MKRKRSHNARRTTRGKVALKSAKAAPGTYFARLPVNVIIGLNEAVIGQFDTNIDIDFNVSSPDGKEHIALFGLLTSKQGLSNDDALLTIALSEINKDRARIAQEHARPEYKDAGIHIRLVGAITYGKVLDAQ